jgi:cobalt/nickel transport system ATP-binding protein
LTSQRGLAVPAGRPYIASMSLPTPAVECERVSYRYPDGRDALCAISFRIEPGETVGLVGPNGAGKTTLLLCLAGVLIPSQGRVRVLDLDLSNPADRKRAPRRLGLVFQDPDDQLFSPTVLDDVAFGPLNLGLIEDEARRRATESLTQVGLEGFEGRAPHRLSGGEKRRAALAGVLAMGPELLLLDEPTAFLDPRGRRELAGVLKQLPQTKLIAAHDLGLIRATCGRALLLDQGRLLAEGAPAKVFSDHALLFEHGLEE